MKKTLLATIIACSTLFGGIAGATATSVFSDSGWWTPAAEWANKHNLMTGMGDGSFGGDKYVTRGQLAQVLKNMADQGIITINTPTPMPTPTPTPRPTPAPTPDPTNPKVTAMKEQINQEMTARGKPNLKIKSINVNVDATNKMGLPVKVSKIVFNDSDTDVVRDYFQTYYTGHKDFSTFPDVLGSQYFQYHLQGNTLEIYTAIASTPDLSQKAMDDMKAFLVSKGVDVVKVELENVTKTPQGIPAVGAIYVETKEIGEYPEKVGAMENKDSLTAIQSIFKANVGSYKIDHINGNFTTNWVRIYLTKYDNLEIGSI